MALGSRAILACLLERGGDPAFYIFGFAGGPYRPGVFRASSCVLVTGRAKPLAIEVEE
jgi:hypothetical protein